ncbi:MAG: flavin reductase family protein, partial [Micromonosporaceae bacterium]
MQIEPDQARTGDSQLLRQCFGAFATGVTVVTVGGTHPHGMTANSFTSVSLDPPLVLVCVGLEAHMHGLLLGNERFGVSVLASDQEAAARHFASRARQPGAAQFDAVKWLPGRASGAPLLAGAAAHFECEVWETYDGGDHTIFVSRLLTLARRADADVLVFLNGRFGPARPTRSPARPPGHPTMPEKGGRPGAEL